MMAAPPSTISGDSGRMNFDTKIPKVQTNCEADIQKAYEQKLLLKGFGFGKQCSLWQSVEVIHRTLYT